MTLPAHLAGGYLAIQLASELKPELGLGNDTLYIFVGLIGAILPDLDGFFFKYLKDHHKSPLHAPLFYLVIFTLIYSLDKLFYLKNLELFLVAFLLGIITHLFLDWFSGRTTGLRLFYPFKLKDYSLFPLDPEKGKVPISIIPNKEYKGYLKFYIQNKFLFIVELLLILLALLHLIFM